MIFLAAACSGRKETPVPPPLAPAASPELLRLRAGLTLSLAPNLPGVHLDDMPEATKRDVEVLALDGRSLRLRWTGTVRMETGESARRREEWVRAASNAPAGATPLPMIPGIYETRTITGTLFFPDGASGDSFLLPGLWPEGNATLPGATGLMLPKGALEELKLRGEAKVPLFLKAQSLREPASVLLRRASELATDAHAESPALLKRIAPPRRFSLEVDGRLQEFATVVAANWFGTFEILDDPASPLVLGVLPSPASAPVLDLFAPAKVLKTLLGFRVAGVASPPSEARQ
ncbi:MAG: hypothetical protein ACHQPI_05820 [Thermoanaerobaculia bacterium]